MQRAGSASSDEPFEHDPPSPTTRGKQATDVGHVAGLPTAMPIAGAAPDQSVSESRVRIASDSLN